METKQLVNALEWRYAVKAFDASRKLAPETWQAIERALILSPSSYGLQPYRFYVIADPAKRAALLPHAWNQKQVVDASHFIVFAARTATTLQDVDHFIELNVKQRGVPAEALSAYRGMMVGDLVQGPRSKIIFEWATRQAYIALGNLLTAAAVLAVDACPMEGFSPSDFDQILGLKESGYASVVCCALGYRSPQDKYASLAKVRYSASELIKTL